MFANDFWLLACCLNRNPLMNPFRSPQQVLHIDNRVVCFANRDTVFAHKDVFAIISAEPLCNCKIELYRFLTRFWSNSQFGCSSWWWGQAALHIICIQVSLSFDIVFFLLFYFLHLTNKFFMHLVFNTKYFQMKLNRLTFDVHIFKAFYILVGSGNNNSLLNII